MNPREVPLQITGPAGALEALYRPEAAAGGRGGAVILHPHPLYGGNMHNKVVFTCQRACTELGLATLRFNFRGVGTSAGSYDDGQGEQGDVLAALDHLREQIPGRPLYLVGFSFGAWLSLKIGAEQNDILGIAALGTPVGWAELAFLSRCDKPKLFVHGREDQYCDARELERGFPEMAEPKRLCWVEGADHFFVDKLDELSTILNEEFPFVS
jgi:uncharacterized protein